MSPDKTNDDERMFKIHKEREKMQRESETGRQKKKNNDRRSITR
jgi:hypothetical protein